DEVNSEENGESSHAPDARNPDDGRVVDHPTGQTGSRDTPDSVAARPEASSSSGRSPESSSSPAEHDDAAARLAASLLRVHADRMRQGAREARVRARFTAVHPEVPVVEVSALPDDVRDLAGLRSIGERL